MAQSLQQTAMMAVLAFAAFSLFLVMVHEMHVLHYDSAAVIQGGKIFHRLEMFIKQEVTSLEHGLGFADDDDDNTVIQTGERGESTSKTLGYNSKSSGVASKINGDLDDDDDEGDEGEVGSEGNASEDVGDDEFDDDSVIVTYIGEPKKESAAAVNTSPESLRKKRTKDPQNQDGSTATDSAVAGTGIGAGDNGHGSWWDTLTSLTNNMGGGGNSNSNSNGDGDGDGDGHADSSGSSVENTSSTNPNTKTHPPSSPDDDKDDDSVLKTAVDRDSTGAVHKISDIKGNTVSSSSSSRSSSDKSASSATHQIPPSGKLKQKRGSLVCHGKQVDSEVIYWKEVEGDKEFESPISPHHANHGDRYLSYEYDQGGWNNVRMSMECLIVLAHATGRTVVVPPQQNLYLLSSKHKDPEDKKAHAQMGFEDFFDMDLLYSHKGFHMMHMEDFLKDEGVTGGLHGKLPPDNSTKAWGTKLWKYLDDVADVQPEWMGKFVALPGLSKGSDFDLSEHQDPKLKERMEEFGGGRSAVYYDDQMQKVHHLHFPADHTHRVLQHFYAFVFFANPDMQSFYKRFIRDYMRYKDPIQCAGSELLEHVRKDSLKQNPEGGGEFYALHVRRGDFQFKEVKISAAEIVKNMNGLIPKGALVYLSTDDPDGTCQNCVALRKPCDSYEKGNKPVGCPEDCTWRAFKDAGWKVRTLRDYLKQGEIKGANPNWYGMIESIVCSRAKMFAGTYFSTFSGYIHRLRGYHGLGEETYYHSAKFLRVLQKGKSVGHGFSREWRMGWTNDAGEPI